MVKDLGSGQGAPTYDEMMEWDFGNRKREFFRSLLHCGLQGMVVVVIAAALLTPAGRGGYCLSSFTTMSRATVAPQFNGRSA